MEETQEDNHSCPKPTGVVQSLQEVTIEAQAIFEAALTKLGSNQHKIQFETTHNQKYFAILNVEINDYPYTENPKKTTIYSYFHDDIKDAREDAYSGGVDWLQSEFNLIIDIKANRKVKEAEDKLRMATTMASILEDKYIKVADEAAKVRNQKQLAMAEMLMTAENMPGMLGLVENTTPLKPNSKSYPHMIYVGQDPPKTEKERLAECLSKVYSVLRLA